MKKRTRNKLIRDKAPEFIKKEGKSAEIVILDDTRFRQELFKKLVEEAQEIAQAAGDQEKLMKEISNIFEVIEAIIKSYSLKKEKIIEIQKKKKNQGRRF